MDLETVIFAGTNTFAQIGVKEILKDRCKQFDIISEPGLLTKNLNNSVSLVIYYFSKESGFDKSLLTNIQNLNLVPVLVITEDYSTEMVQYFFNEAIKGCLTDNCSLEEIEKAIENVTVGKQFFCNSVLNNALGTPDEENCFPSLLTERETEIVTLIANGNTSKQIAEQLFVSIHTVNTHRKNISKKIGAKGASDIVLYAINEGLKD